MLDAVCWVLKNSGEPAGRGAMRGMVILWGVLGCRQREFRQQALLQ